jgi:hypothetical protein
MKKMLLKFTGIAALAALMAYNVQLFEADNDFDISLAYLANMAYAQDESNCDLCVVTKSGETIFSSV